VDNEEIPIDPFRKLGEVAECMREKGVLTLEERNTLIAAPVTDYRKVPIPTAVQELLDTAWKFACKPAPDIAPDAISEPSPDSFVLESPLYPEKPLGNNF
jgi:hypothetical protein